ITVDTDGDYDLGDETVTTINSMLMEKTVCFTANADGKLTGSIVFPGTSGEGDLAGIRLALLTGTPIPGDTNNDHKVDKTDARTLATYWLMDVPNGDITKGDFNGDGKVDDLDASILAANWSETSEGSQVPEPSCFVLALGMVLGLSALRKRRRRC
ncbi:MAG: hypothetical protein JW818_11275, partial [Pirellulales bacterium]|nr:hypothetical protein [Pirellulales bacterium]